MKSKTIAACGMTAALSVVIMLLGGVLELGMYLSPMICGFCLAPIGRRHGIKYQWLVWGCVSILSFMLVPNAEENLMYAAIFGLYPILYPWFQKLPRGLRWPGKLAYFNLVTLGVEALIIWVLVPEVMTWWMGLILMAMGNIVFMMYDFLLPRTDLLMKRCLGKRSKP
ncbi:MAG: hypothetical protein IJ461_05310 [Clostridia bacterium]|nr:hypothetical protein [Clostridia bacterium]